MSILLRCEGTSCPAYHPILGSILDDGTLRQLINTRKFHVQHGCVTLGCRACGYERQVIIPAPPQEFRVY